MEDDNMPQYCRYKDTGTIYLVCPATRCGILKAKGSLALCVYYKVAHPKPDKGWYVGPPDLAHPFVREEWEFYTKFDHLGIEEISTIGLPFLRAHRRFITTDNPAPLEPS